MLRRTFRNRHAVTNGIGVQVDRNLQTQVGNGPKMVMKRFDAMVNGFADAINQAKEELKDMGFEHVEQICEMIMEKGGISRFMEN